MIFVVGGGGGKLKDTDAVLVVTVPTGSTVTATKGGTTLTPTMWVKAADNTLDCAIFSIPASQFDSTTPWTVTATLGTETASDTITVDSNKQYNIVLEYGLVLFYYGEERVTWGAYGRSGGAQGWAGQAPTVSKYTDYYSLWFSGSKGGIFATEDKIDLSPYTTLKVDITGVTTSGNIRFGALDRTTINMNGGMGAASTLLSVSSEEHKITSVDIASVNSSQHIGFWLYAANGAGITNLWKVWLEK